MALRTSLAKSAREQEIFDEHFRKFWYVWESSEEFYRKPPREEEEERAKIRVIDERQQKSTYLSINDWMNQESESEEVKEAAGYSPFEVDTERDFSQFGTEELQDVIGPGVFIQPKTIDSHVKGLRKRFKLLGIQKGTIIKTRPGFGYQLGACQ